MEGPCSNCRVIFDVEDLSNREDLGLSCEALCEQCELAILEETHNDMREREYYAERRIEDAEGWK